MLSALLLTTLLYTSPCSLIHRELVWDEQRQDSVMTEDCTPGTAAHDSMTVYLYKRPNGPGQQFAAIDSHRVAPCKPDSFPKQGPGFYYAAARNASGPPKCGSNMVTIMPPDLTSVDLVLPPLIESCSLFNVHGRFVRNVSAAYFYRPSLLPGMASGIYYLRAVAPDGSIIKKRIVLLR